MSGIVIGTAGHVDHGKTTLIKALTGYDTDRLKEEKQRAISIDLGFAKCVLPDGKIVGIVDVPGHERFLKNMLAGAGGIDLALLVIAADEGIMPQTIEHFQILQLLGIGNGIIVLTKTDAVEPEWIDLVEQDIRERFAGSVFAQAPILRVDSISGTGLDQLLQAIAEAVARSQTKDSQAPLRMPIDRVFTVRGFGTVVTGTVWSGQLRENQKINIEPLGKTVRVRGLQVFGSKVSEASAGERVACNLTDISVGLLGRGCVLGDERGLPTANAFAVAFESVQPRLIIKPGSQVRVYIGTGEYIATASPIKKGQVDGTFLYIRSNNPVVVIPGDRIVVRLHSPQVLLGGGVVVAIGPKSNSWNLPGRSQALQQKSIAELAYQLLQERDKVWEVDQLQQACGMISQASWSETLQTLANKQGVTMLRYDNKSLIVAWQCVERWQQLVVLVLENYHRQCPYRAGMPILELREAMPVCAREYLDVLVQYWQELKLVKSVNKYVALASHTASFEGKFEKIRQSIEQYFFDKPYAPPELDKIYCILDGVEKEVCEYLLETGTLVQIENITFHRDAITRMLQKVREHFASQEVLTVGQFRDFLNTTRKYAVPLLEYLDQQKITERQGEIRTLCRFL